MKKIKLAAIFTVIFCLLASNIEFFPAANAGAGQTDTSKWAFIGDHVSSFQLAPDITKVIRKDHDYPENDDYNYGDYFDPAKSPQFICYDGLTDIEATMKLVDKDTTDIVINRTPLYNWGRTFLKISDEIDEIGYMINQIRAARPDIRIHMVSALPLTQSAPKVDDKTDMEKWGEIIEYINNHTIEFPSSNGWFEHIPVKNRLDANEFKEFNAALKELMEIKRVNFIDLYESGLIDDDGWLKEEYAAETGYGLQLNAAGVEMLGKAIEDGVTLGNAYLIPESQIKRELYAGFAQRETSPRTPVALQGQFDIRVVDEIKYPLYTNIVVLETRVNGVREETSVWVSLDISTVQGTLQQKVMDGIEKLGLGINKTHVFIGSTHTHDAPFLVEKVIESWLPDYEGTINFPAAEKENHPDLVTPDEYTDFVAGKILDGIKEAWNKRVKANVGAGTGYADVAMPDRGYFDNGDGTWYLDWSFGKQNMRGFLNDLDGIKNVETLGFWDAKTNKLIGLVAGVYAPAQTSDNDRFVSSDYWHFVRQSLKSKYNINVPMVTLQLFSGDCGPKGSLEENGERIADGIKQGLDKAKNNIYDNPVLQHERFRVDNLPLYTSTKEEYEKAKANLERRKEQGEENWFADYFDYAEYIRYIRQMEDPTEELYVH
ncbi:MAG TPA: hypothetical protein PLZ84_05025, partial [Clostridia bacterium]|nr:hypothetical protein [Clostridia bacterium]